MFLRNVSDSDVSNIGSGKDLGLVPYRLNVLRRNVGEYHRLSLYLYRILQQNKRDKGDPRQY